MTKTKAQIKENGIKELLEKSTIRKVDNTSGEFLNNMILVKKKDGETDDFIPYQHFRMKGLHCWNIYGEGKWLPFQNQLERYLFLCATEQRILKIRQICFVGESIRNVLFWSRSCTANFYQIIENYSNSFTEKTEHSPNGLFGQHSNYWENFRRNANELGYDDFFLRQQLGFIINIKTSVLEPTQKTEFLELIIDTPKMIQLWYRKN